MLYSRKNNMLKDMKDRILSLFMHITPQDIQQDKYDLHCINKNRLYKISILSELRNT